MQRLLDLVRLLSLGRWRGTEPSIELRRLAKVLQPFRRQR
jgi:hypothetical protein